MRYVLILAAVVGAFAGPAAADFGAMKSPKPGFQASKPGAPMSPGASRYAPQPMPSYGSSYGAAASSAKPRTYGAPPVAEPYKPYQPYKSQPGSSLFGPDARKKY